jgi:hypothetical protein
MSAVDSLIQSIPIDCTQGQDAGEVTCIYRLERAFFESAAALGFEYARYTCWTQDISNHSNFPYAFSFNFSNFPVEWDGEYERNQYYLSDPLVKMFVGNTGVPLVFGSWREAWQQEEQRAKKMQDDVYLHKLRQLIKGVSAYGIHDGIYMMINTGINRIATSFGRKASSEEQNNIGDLKSVYRQIFSIVSLLSQALSQTNTCHSCKAALRIAGGHPVKLTPKQTRILEVFSKNSAFTNGDVAKALCVSTEAIAFHLKAIRRKLQKPSASGHALSHIAKAHGLI